MAGVNGGPDEDRPGRGAAVVKLGLLVLLVLGGILVTRMTPLGDVLSREGVGEIITRLRGSTWAPVIFVGLYALATAVAIPGTVLTLAGGALFGFFWGTVYNSIAANIGANLAFLVARFLGRDAVEVLAGERLDKLDRATKAHGFRGLLTLRLVPLVPFNALNFGSGLTAMSWPVYAGATLVGILPGTIVYTMFADALLMGSREASRDALTRVLVSGGLLVLLAFLPTILDKLNIRLPRGTALLAALALPWALATSPGAAASVARPDARSAGAPSAVLSPRGGPDLPDHGAFTAVLQDVVHGSRIDYEGVQARRAALGDYLTSLADTPLSAVEAASVEARLAFWINAYNACMLDLVADHYPVEEASGPFLKMKNLLAGRPANSVWQIEDVFTRPHCPVAGQPRSQDEIEHEILRPLGEPRIHFAINCAALSCPPLIPEAYVADRIDAQLDARVRAFVADPHHFRLERNGDPTLHLNRVLDWFGEDFGGVDGLRDFFQPYVDADLGRIIADPETEVSFMDYDWTLNDVTR